MSGAPNDQRGTALHTPPAVDVGALDDLPPGSTMRVPVGSAELMLANVNGVVLAVDDLCLRCSSSLSAAAVRGPLLTCLHCGWQYDLQRGEVIGLPALKLGRHAAWIVGGRILVSADEVAARDALA